MEETFQAQKSRAEAFVEYTIEKLKTDSAFGAALRRANNPTTEYQSWEYLAPWCDLEKSWDRIPFATIAAALARAKPKEDGVVGIGMVLATCYDGGKDASPAKTRLRRLLACRSKEEACRILQPILSLVLSKGKGSALSYSSLLNDLLYFGERQKLKWATDFYGRRQDDSDNT